MSLDRPVLVNDPGDRITGTLFDEAWWEDFFDRLDAAYSSLDDAAAFTDTTDSTSPTTGAVTIAGGLGVAKKVSVGESVTARNLVEVYDPNTFKGIDLKHSSNLNGGDYAVFRNAAGTIIGEIFQATSTTVTYATSSDARMKRDRGLAVDTTVLRDTKVHDFDWEDTGARDVGVFAQEAVLVKPQAVKVGSDDTNEDGSLVEPWKVDYSRYVSDLIVGWQAHERRIAELEATVSRLEHQIKK